MIAVRHGRLALFVRGFVTNIARPASSPVSFGARGKRVAPHGSSSSALRHAIGQGWRCAGSGPGVDDAENPVRSGVVKFWNSEKGFGFISVKDGSDDLFFHQSNVPDQGHIKLSAGMKVNYSRSWNERRRAYWAVSVTPIGTFDDDEHLPASSSSFPQPSSALVRSSSSSSPQSATAQMLAGSGVGCEADNGVGEATDIGPAFSAASMAPPKTGASVDERLNWLTTQMQVVHNQQMLLRGMYEMLKQQARHNANLERALFAIADRLGDRTLIADMPADTGGDVTTQGKGEQHRLAAVTTREEVAPGAAPGTSQAKANSDSGSTPCSTMLASQAPESAGSTSSRKRTFLDDKVDDASMAKDSKTSKARARAGADVVGVGNTSVSGASSSTSSSSSARDSSPPETSSSTRPLDVKVLPWPVKSFHLVGSFSDWNIDAQPMGDKGGTFRIRREAPRAGDAGGDLRREEFQIVGDSDWVKRVFPKSGDGKEPVILRPGQTSMATCGSGDDGHGRNWAVEGKPGNTFRIRYSPDAGTLRCERV